MEPFQYRPAADIGLSPEEQLRSLQREAGLMACLTQSAWRAATRLYLKGYHRLTVLGREHLPKSAPFVMIANHASHLDALILGASLPWKHRRSIFPIAAGDVFFETPAVSLFSAMMLNALPMWRKRCGSHALQELRDRLIGEPAIYLLFPEGTRSRDGQIGPFKPGIGMMVASAAAPVVPCHLSGVFEALPPGCNVPRPRRLTVRIGKPLTFNQVSNDRPGWMQIAETLRAAVVGLAQSAPELSPEAVDKQADAGSCSRAERP